MSWVRRNWFVVLVAFWTSLTSLSDILTQWLSLGFLEFVWEWHRSLH